MVRNLMEHLWQLEANYPSMKVARSSIDVTAIALWKLYFLYLSPDLLLHSPSIHPSSFSIYACKQENREENEKGKKKCMMR